MVEDPSPALAGEGWGDGRGIYHDPHPAQQPVERRASSTPVAPPSPASGRREPRAAGVDFPREVPYHCGSARFKSSPNRRRSRKIGRLGGFGMHGRTLLPGRPLKPSETRDYMIGRADASELFSDRFITRLKTLNAFVRDAEEVIEGGIFYWDRDADFFDKMPDPSLAPARRNLWRATRFKRSLLEIGVNAGHSALLSLSANDNLVYHGVDNGSHIYTDACVNYLAREFPGRVCFYPGDSREVLPYLATHRRELEFDIFHVDGGHTDGLCRTDISNCIRLAGGGFGKHLLLDDINASWIFDVYCEYVALGHLSTETLFSDWEDVNRNVFARIS